MKSLHSNADETFVAVNRVVVFERRWPPEGAEEATVVTEVDTALVWTERAYD